MKSLSVYNFYLIFSFSFVCLDLLGRLNNYTYVIWEGFFFQCFSFSYGTFCGVQNRSAFKTPSSADPVGSGLSVMDSTLQLP